MDLHTILNTRRKKPKENSKASKAKTSTMLNVVTKRVIPISQKSVEPINFRSQKNLL